MFAPFTIRGTVKRFDGPTGWHYLPLDVRHSAALRPLVTESWPALLKVTATIGDHAWVATVMPIKDGPLFIAITAPVRKKLGIRVGQALSVAIEPKSP